MSLVQQQSHGNQVLNNVKENEIEKISYGISLGKKIKPELKTQCETKKEQTCQGYESF